MFFLKHFDASGFERDTLETLDREAAISWFNERAGEGKITITEDHSRVYWRNPGVKRLDLRSGKTPMERSKQEPLFEPITSSVRIGLREYQAITDFGGSLSGGVNRLGKMLMENSDTFDTIAQKYRKPKTS